MTKAQHIYDIVVRSLKTGLAAYVAFAAAGGLNLVHLSPHIQFDLAYLATLATALLNIGIKVQSAVTSKVNTPPTAPTAV